MTPQNRSEQSNTANSLDQLGAEVFLYAAQAFQRETDYHLQEPKL